MKMMEELRRLRLEKAESEKENSFLNNQRLLFCRKSLTVVAETDTLLATLKKSLRLFVRPLHSCRGLFFMECPVGLGLEACGAHPCVTGAYVLSSTFPRYRSLEKRCRIEVCKLDCFSLHRKRCLQFCGAAIGKMALRC